MRFVLTTVDTAATVTDHVLDTEPDSTVGELSQVLARGGRRPVLYVAGAPLDPQLTLRDSPMRQGSVVGLDRPVAAVFAEPRGLVEIRAVSGPGAGAVHRLDVGEHLIGPASNCRVRISGDPADPPVSARLRVFPDGRCELVPVGGKRILLEREGVTEPTPWLPNAQLAIGAVLLSLSRPVPPDAAVQPSEDGAGLDYNRPPRLLPPPRVTQFQLPAKPKPPERRALPLIAAASPVVMSGAMFAFTGNPLTLLFALLSPLIIIGNQISNKRQGQISYREQVAAYDEKKARIDADAQEALVLERTARRHSFPDPADVLLTATGPRRRLWERRRSDPDYLELRAGTADLPSEVVLRDPEQDEHKREVRWDALDVPVTIPLREHGVLGVAGGQVAYSVARWLVAQSAALHSPEDLQIYLLTGPQGEQQWAWTRWLPHLAPRVGEDTMATVGTNATTVARRIAELSQLISQRQGAKGVPRDVLVVLDGARRLRSLPGIPQILRDGPAVGVYAICVDSEERLLPEECQAVVIEQPDGRIRVGRTRSAPVPDVRPDLVPYDWCRTVSRALAPLRDVGGKEDAGALPNSSRLLDVLSLEPPTADGVAARWTTGGRTTTAIMGESLDGAFALDLKRDGPHALVAGTTGSGKSELLQTLVASLAVANRPDAMTFVLVDYKGGSAFKDCVSLPHTVGMVTDLDTHLVSRALTSLSAELKRREHILADHGAKDIDDYVLLLDRNPGMPDMPRLLIVIDEFASMVRDLPDFVTGLVNIAQRGRSLGIHLVLATQRPGGVVSPEIRANTNLRIALRVTDSSESQDVLNGPDAASISKSTPGRAYVRLGQSSLVPFQAGRVGGFRPGARTTGRVLPWLSPVRWPDLALPGPSRPRAEVAENTEATDLSVLVGAVRQAADQLGLPPQPSPWLPALPSSMTVDDLPAVAATGYLKPVAYGIVDLPADQRQEPLVLDFATLGHLHVAGSARSGRSQVLRTMAGALLREHSPQDVHLYGIDCGNGALLALVNFPHVGAIVQRAEAERLSRLLARLSAESARRQQLLASTGSANLVEYRAAQTDDRPPHIVVMVDRWEVFDKTYADYDGGTLMNTVLALLRDGASVGIHLILAGDRALFSSRVSSTTEDKLVLRLNERADYSVIGLNHRNLPDEIEPGRAFRAGDGSEAQIALLTTDPAGQAQARALLAIAEESTPRWAAVPVAARPFRVDVLPEQLTYAQARGIAPAVEPLRPFVGVGGDELTGLVPDLTVTPTFVIGGPARSGRSTVLLTIVAGLLRAGTPVVIAAPRRSPLRDLAGVEGVLDIATDGEFSMGQLVSALDKADGPAAVVIDDAELLLKCDAGSELGVIARTGAEQGRALVMAGTTEGLAGGFGGWHVDARRNRQGMLISPQQLGDGELFGAKLSRGQLGAGRPGRALAHFGDGRIHVVQVPETTTEDVLAAVR
ncbi:FtsK/SpoIIIE domain-containing protein [Lentzea sp. JNUCC 0626]|uniref:FtsK/SpoIIIE domain-containing protein n=1 Tax=Lentzea sp. JNUCC 0626 TaxID=3367513 RepID=UPI00374939A5